MIFIKLIVPNTHIVFQHLLKVMLCILFSLHCLAQNENIQTNMVPNLNQFISTTKSQKLSLPDHLSNEKDWCNNKYNKQVIIPTNKALNKIIQQQEQLIQMTSKIDSVTACMQNCTKMIVCYLKDRKSEIKQFLNTYRSIKRLRTSWRRSVGGCISISNHLLRIKKQSATLFKMKPELHSICRNCPPFIDTYQNAVLIQQFVPPNHLII
jgi:hypothetical protein